jgi:hypothetical protein
MSATSVELLHVVSLTHKKKKRFGVVVELVKTGGRPKVFPQQDFQLGTFPEPSAIVRIDGDKPELTWQSTRHLSLTYMAHAVPR